MRSNADASPLADDKAAQSALECILVERVNWYSTISMAAEALIQTKQNGFALSIGTDALPHSVARTIPVIKAKRFATQVEENSYAAEEAENSVPGYPKDAIAIIGMAGRFPGADNVEEYYAGDLPEGTNPLTHFLTIGGAAGGVNRFRAVPTTLPPAVSDPIDMQTCFGFRRHAPKLPRRARSK